MTRPVDLMRRYSVATVALLLFGTGAVAAETGDTEKSNQPDWRAWPLGDRLRVALGAFRPQLSTRVRVDASSGIAGTTIDFEQNLGMSDTVSLPSLELGWRFARKHRFKLRMFELSRSGAAISSTEIRFGDRVFEVNLPVASFFDTKIYEVGYAYSLVFDDRKELSLTAGLSWQDIQFGLAGNRGLGIIESESEVTGLLPAIGLTGGYALSDRWLARAGLGYFSVDLALSDEKRLGGEIVMANAAIEHRTFENVRFGIAYSYFDVDIEFEDALRLSMLRYKYHGPTLQVVAAF